MRSGILNYLIFVIEFPFPIFAMQNQDDSSLTDQKLLSRKKRYLSFPEGSILQLGYCLQVAGVIRPDLIFGYTIGTNWELPTTENFDFRFYKKKAEVVHRRHRRELYAKLEPILTTMGLDGRQCVLRALCESGRRRPEKGTFLQEILYSVFTFPPSTEPEFEESYQIYDRAHRETHNCSALFPTCPTSLLEPSTLT
ncbi:uncharacterized protein LOC110836749 [Zootermopsis nevadensis]|uniref:uncharacterized protein LOC110836749 n=1 Tax=Zootermopsis nevadensis TaxID=136037 RepID=UPI000B8ED532|nr:uncharacterized protein LOC110836749 [Zootermopsis nevadensis]